MNSRSWLILLLFLFLFLSIVTLSRNPLQNDDAALYALAAKNAVVHNQWLAQFITPGDLSSFLDKPPLGIWLLAWFPKIFGVNELTIHFPNVIYFTLLLTIMYFSLAKLSSKKLAFYSTLITATSLCLVVYSRAPKLDVLLTLFVFIAHIALYDFIKNNRPISLFPFTVSLAFGFLIKSGFGILLPALTVLFLLIFNSPARKKITNVLLTPNSLLNALLFFIIVGGVLALQSIPLGNQFIPYLKAITIQSRYNTSYVGFGIYTSVIGFLLITIFPWSPLWLTALKIKRSNTPHLSVGYQKLTLSDFCNLWFWSNIFFLFFFYRQNDLRTFTVLVPPLAILAAMKLIGLRRPSRWVLGWQFFFVVVFSLILIGAIMKPVSPEGFSLAAAIVPLALFVVSLLALTFYFWKPAAPKLAFSFFLIVISYSVLFYNTKPIADAFNPDLRWPGIIKEQKEKGAKFYIYRPPDRPLFYSPDLFWVDFMAGPADQYFWNGEKLKKALIKGKIIVLSDMKSWEKLKLRNVRVLARDSYSELVITRPY